ncbi:MAG: tetratricopeptide repeat protein [Gemmatimonadota bacterium]
MHLRNPPSPHSLGLILAGALSVVGCATGLPDVTPAQIPELESEVSSNGSDPDVQTRLGIAYYRDQRFDEAEATLESALEDGAESGAVYLYLGLANESRADWEGARQAYNAYVETGRRGPLLGDIQARIAFIVSQEARAQAEAALEQEAQLSGSQPADRSVAVFPLRLVTDDPRLEPLGVALADMMITDLALAGGMIVLERRMIQALLDEMALSEAGYTEEATGARAGRLLRAEHVIQGALTTAGQEQIQMAADVRHTVREESTAEVSTGGPLEDFFDLEKETVFEVLDALGVELTPAEREAINENGTESLLAFLAYGRGLQALDRGDYDQAESEFEDAVELDPSFDMAENQLQLASRIQRGATVDPRQIDLRAALEVEGALAGTDQPTTDLGSTTRTILEQTSLRTVPNRAQSLTGLGTVDDGAIIQTDTRNPTQEATDSDQITRPVGTINIVIHNPTGGQ